MTNGQSLAEYIKRKKAVFMGTSSPDIENECIFTANEAINSAIDNQVIVLDSWNHYHNDITDWGMQKTMSEVRALPVKVRAICYKDYIL